MRVPLTLSAYIARQFFQSTMLALAVVLSIIGIIEMVELIRRASNKAFEVPFGVIAEMTLLKIPHTAEKVLPYALLIGGMLALSRLTRTHELVVARAAGVSVWQFLMPGLVIAFAIGALFVTALNPIAAAMISRFEQIEGKYITERPSLLAVFPSGLWLRQVEKVGGEIGGQSIDEYIIHSRRISQQDMSLSNVVIFLYTEPNRFVGRIDAKKAKLEQGYWYIENAMVSVPGEAAEKQPSYRLKTDLSINQIQESFASPKTLSFWELPGFIHMLERAGFSALRHKLHWHSVLASPLLLCAMVLIAAVFSLRLPRRGRLGVMVVACMLTGFLVNFFSNLVFALGSSGSLPVAVAAWTPAIASIMIGVALLLHLEDG